MLKFCLPRGDPLGKEDGWIFREDKGRTLLSLRISLQPRRVSATSRAEWEECPPPLGTPPSPSLLLKPAAATALIELGRRFQ